MPPRGGTTPLGGGSRGRSARPSTATAAAGRADPLWPPNESVDRSDMCPVLKSKSHARRRLNFEETPPQEAKPSVGLWVLDSVAGFFGSETAEQFSRIDDAFAVSLVEQFYLHHKEHFAKLMSPTSTYEPTVNDENVPWSTPSRPSSHRRHKTRS